VHLGRIVRKVYGGAPLGSELTNARGHSMASQFVSKTLPPDGLSNVGPLSEASSDWQSQLANFDLPTVIRSIMSCQCVFCRGACIV
jgi:hypothetical protein